MRRMAQDQFRSRADVMDALHLRAGPRERIERPLDPLQDIMYIFDSERDANYDEKFPESCVTLAQGHESFGREIVLDTEEGLLCIEQVRAGRDTYGDVFEVLRSLKEMFQHLDLIPLPTEEGLFVEEIQDDDEHLAKLQEIYRVHQWGTADYRKHEALQAAREYCEAHEISNP
ncbi:hypothetical protein B0H11DRAFT_2063114 [Mycena galericulata]|nr:hypothetical protein B0H11DRAFT_2063114 [Mycena galericulata]